MDGKLKNCYISIAYNWHNLEKSLVKSPQLAKWSNAIWSEFQVMFWQEAKSRGRIGVHLETTQCYSEYFG